MAITIEDLYLEAKKLGAERALICVWEDNGVDSYWTSRIEPDFDKNSGTVALKTLYCKTDKPLIR